MSVRNPLEDKWWLADLVALGLLPLALTAVHFLLPDSLQQRLVLDHSDLDALTMWTSAYLHLDDAHLWSNVMGYAMTVLPAWILAVYRERRSEFWTVLLVILLVGPFAVNAVSHLAFRHYGVVDDAVSRGFSGLVSAIGGYLLVAVVGLVNDTYGTERAFQSAQALVLVLLGAILSVSLASVSTLVVAVWAGGMVLSLVPLVPRGVDGLRARVEADLLPLLLVGYGTVALVYFVPSMLTTDVVQDGAFVNVFGHAGGFVVGVLTPVALLSTAGTVTLRPGG